MTFIIDFLLIIMPSCKPLTAVEKTATAQYATQSAISTERAPTWAAATATAVQRPIDAATRSFAMTASASGIDRVEIPIMDGAIEIVRDATGVSYQTKHSNYDVIRFYVQYFGLEGAMGVKSYTLTGYSGGKISGSSINDEICWNITDLYVFVHVGRNATSNTGIGFVRVSLVNPRSESACNRNESIREVLAPMLAAAVPDSINIGDETYIDR